MGEQSMRPTELVQFKILNRIAGYRLIVNSVTKCWTKSNCNINNYQTVKFGGEITGLHVVSAMIFHQLNFNANNHNVLHKCDIPACCNPSHIYLGSSQDNSNDMKHRRKNYVIQGCLIKREESPDVTLRFLN